MVFDTAPKLPKSSVKKQVLLYIKIMWTKNFLMYLESMEALENSLLMVYCATLIQYYLALAALLQITNVYPCLRSSKEIDK